MRGFVFVELIELVERLHGIDAADKLIESCQLQSGGAYTSVDSYATEELVELVSQLSRQTGTPVPDLLRTYGEHLFDALALSHQQIIAEIDHPFELFKSLEYHVHAEVRKLYSNAEVPHFEWKDTGPDRMCLTYKSVRAMPDLAEGLIRGACRHYGRSVEIRREDRSGGKGTNVDFFLQLV